MVEKKKLEYPYNLLYEIMGASFYEAHYGAGRPLSETQIDGIELALEYVGGKREKVLKSRFRDGKTYREIGDNLGRSWQLARYLVEEGIRKIGRRIFSELDRQNPNSLRTFGLSTRSFNALRRAGVNGVDQLVQMSDDVLLGIRNLGKKSVQEIREAVEKSTENESEVTYWVEMIFGDRWIEAVDDYNTTH